MKKILTKILIIVFALGMVGSAMLFCGCQSAVTLSNVSVNIKAEYADTNGEFELGDFKFDRYEVVSTFSDGSVKVRDLTYEDVDEGDLVKFWKAKTHVIKCNIDGFECSFTCIGKDNVFSGVTLKDIDVVYTGETFALEIDGRLPEGTKIEYPDGQYFKDVGEWDVKAHLSCDNYVDKVLTAKVKISRATYDVSTFVFKDDTVTYDGEEHTLSGTGTLPEGVTVSYFIGKMEDGKQLSLTRGNSAQDIGRYYVEARFNYSDPNYNRIESKIAYLNIIKIKVDLKDVENDLLRQSREMRFYNGEDQRLDLSPTFVVPDKLDFSKVVKKYYKVDDNGVATEIPDDKPIVKVGTYAVELSNFKVKDNYSRIYEVEQSEIYVVYTVYPQAVDYSLIFTDKEFVYDGNDHRLTFDSHNIPSTSTMAVTGYEYTLDGKVVDSVIDAGEYTVKVLFTQDENFYVKPFSAKLTILPYEYKPTNELVYAVDYVVGGIALADVEDELKEILFDGCLSYVADAVKEVKFLTEDGKELTRFPVSGKYVVNAQVVTTSNISTKLYPFDFTVRKIDLPENVKELVVQPIEIKYGESLHLAILSHLAIVDDLCPGLEYIPCLTGTDGELNYAGVVSGAVLPDAGNYTFEMKEFETDNYYYNDAKFSVTVNKSVLPDVIKSVINLGDIEVFYQENAIDYVMFSYNEKAIKDLGYDGIFTDEFLFEYKIKDSSGTERRADEVLESGEYTVIVGGLNHKNYYLTDNYQYKLTVSPM
ncbi:MAG: hypothetical protein MJ072_00845, partial [Clostridia bacterium]|nr:hypothetical protein [Clostridia bacterium]